MKSKDKPGREHRKEPGLFGRDRKRRRERRKYMIALLLGGKQCADQCVADGKINVMGWKREQR